MRLARHAAGAARRHCAAGGGVVDVAAAQRWAGARHDERAAHKQRPPLAARVEVAGQRGGARVALRTSPLARDRLRVLLGDIGGLRSRALEVAIGERVIRDMCRIHVVRRATRGGGAAGVGRPPAAQLARRARHPGAAVGGVHGARVGGRRLRARDQRQAAREDERGGAALAGHRRPAGVAIRALPPAAATPDIPVRDKVRVHTRLELAEREVVPDRVLRVGVVQGADVVRRRGVRRGRGGGGPRRGPRGGGARVARDVGRVGGRGGRGRG